MTDAEHVELVELEKTGKVLVGVDRSTARRLFTDVPIRRIAEKTGYAPYLEKGIVLSFLVLGPLALLGSIVAAFIEFGWWGMVALVACPLSIRGLPGRFLSRRCRSISDQCLVGRCGRDLCL